MRKLLSSLTVLIISWFVGYLVITGKIAIFIHPRYFGLTRWMAIIGLVFGIVGTLYFLGNLYENRKEKFDRETLVGISLIVAFALFGFTYPIKPISSATLSQRSNEINFVQRKTLNLNKFSTDTTEYDISEWVYLFQSEPNWESFEGKKVELEGFLYSEESMPDGFFLISKFIISCCAVDARPVGLPVQYDWVGQYKLDQWFKVRGELKLVQYKDSENLVIVPESLEVIEIPDNPYIY